MPYSAERIASVWGLAAGSGAGESVSNECATNAGRVGFPGPNTTNTEPVDGSERITPDVCLLELQTWAGLVLPVSGSNNHGTLPTVRNSMLPSKGCPDWLEMK